MRNRRARAVSDFEVSHSLRLERAARVARKAGVQADYRRGVPVADIAEKYGMSPAYVVKIAREANLTRNKSNELIKPEVVERYARGEPINSICIACGVDRKRVWSWAKEAGLPGRWELRRRLKAEADELLKELEP